MRPIIRWVLPVLVILVGALISVAVVKSKRQVPKQQVELAAPLVRAMTIERRAFEVRVASQGTVEPRTESQLVAQVAGRIVSVSPQFAAGGLFEKGDRLLSIESSDYEVAVVQARGQVANGELVLAQEKAEAALARREWKELGQGETSSLNTRELQVKRAEANLASAQAALRQAETNLARTRVLAPYRGRVRSKNVDLGQYVGPGSSLGRVFSDDAAEIRLPIPDRDLAYLDFDLNGGLAEESVHVLLESDFAGQRHSWDARIVRVESAIDPQTRMIHVIARVDDPYRRIPGKPPLSAGLFVEATITASTLQNVAVLPREALRDDNTVLVVEENQIRIRPVRVVREQNDLVAIEGGLEAGTVVCLSRLAVVSDGMAVRTVEVEETS